WTGFALLPWHMLSQGWADWLTALPSEGPRSAAALVLAGQTWWLAPIVLALLAATVPLFSASRGRSGRMLIVAGLAGIALIAAQGLAIGLQGWSWAFLA